MAQVGLPMALIRHPNPAMIKSRALRSAWEYSRGKPTCYPFSSLLEGDLDKYAKYKTIWGLKVRGEVHVCQGPNVPLCLLPTWFALRWKGEDVYTRLPMNILRSADGQSIHGAQF